MQSFESFVAEQRAQCEAQCARKRQLECALQAPCTGLEARRQRVQLQQELALLQHVSLERFEHVLAPFTTLHGVLSDAQLVALYSKEVLQSPASSPLPSPPTSVPKPAARKRRRGEPVEDTKAQPEPQPEPSELVDWIDTERCARCSSYLLHSSEPGVMLCLSCGRMSACANATALGAGSGGGFCDEVDCSSSAYRRVNHLHERLNHFQAKETTAILPEVHESLMRQLRRQGLTCASAVTMKDIKEALKQCGLRKYYDQTMQIWCHLTARAPIRLEPQFLEKVLLMFRHIQAPFKRHCPRERKNFLSYPYLLFKCSQLLGYPHLLPYWPLLKGGDKLEAQESLFRRICVDLRWKFVPVPPEYRHRADDGRSRSKAGPTRPGADHAT